jgi:AbrB family looped-hinge helix DNA binding protein
LLVRRIRTLPAATLTSKGQTTIPKEVRDHLKLQSGDQIDFIIQPDGTVLIRPATIQVHELKGMLHRTGLKPVSVETMTNVVRKRFAKVK